MLTELERKHPTLRQTMLAAMGNVNPSHLFDPKLAALVASGGPAPPRRPPPPNAESKLAIAASGRLSWRLRPDTGVGRRPCAAPAQVGPA